MCRRFNSARKFVTQSPYTHYAKGGTGFGIARVTGGLKQGQSGQHRMSDKGQNYPFQVTGANVSPSPKRTLVARRQCERVSLETAYDPVVRVLHGSFQPLIFPASA